MLFPHVRLMKYEFCLLAIGLHLRRGNLCTNTACMQHAGTSQDGKDAHINIADTSILNNTRLFVYSVRY